MVIANKELLDNFVQSHAQAAKRLRSKLGIDANLILDYA